MTTVTKYTNPGAAGTEVHARAERHMSTKGGTYQAAMRAILAADPELRQAYAMPTARATKPTPAVPVAADDEKEIREWLLRGLEAAMEDALPGELGILAREAAGFKRLGLPIDEAIGRVMGLHPGLVTAAKVQIKNLRRNAPGSADEVTELAQGKTPDETVHLRARALTDKHPDLSYGEALHQALDVRSGAQDQVREVITVSKKFDELVDKALAVERDLLALSADKPSIRGWVSACLSRGGLVYEDIESVKERLGSDFLQTRMVDSGAYCRDLRRYVVGGSVKEPPAADRIQRMFFAQRDGAVAELEGEARLLFALVAIVAEQVYQERPELFGGIDDIDAHKARIAELEAKRKELYAAFPTTWTHGDMHVGRITSDGAALITFKLAPGEIPLHPFATAGERLIEFLLREEAKAETAKAA